MCAGEELTRRADREWRRGDRHAERLQPAPVGGDACERSRFAAAHHAPRHEPDQQSLPLVAGHGERPATVTEARSRRGRGGARIAGAHHRRRIEVDVVLRVTPLAVRVCMHRQRGAAQQVRVVGRVLALRIGDVATPSRHEGGGTVRPAVVALRGHDGDGCRGNRRCQREQCEVVAVALRRVVAGVAVNRAHVDRGATARQVPGVHQHAEIRGRLLESVAEVVIGAVTGRQHEPGRQHLTAALELGCRVGVVAVTAVEDRGLKRHLADRDLRAVHDVRIRSRRAGAADGVTRPRRQSW